MLQAKLYSYTEEEVNRLQELMLANFQQLIDDCPQIEFNENCLHCKQRHVCKDLFEIVDFLEREQENGYKHIFQKKRQTKNRRAASRPAFFSFWRQVKKGIFSLYKDYIILCQYCQALIENLTICSQFPVFHRTFPHFHSTFPQVLKNPVEKKVFHKFQKTLDKRRKL